MRVAAWAVIALGALAVVAALVLCGLAIWTVGPNSARLTGTAFLVALPGALAAAGSSCWLESHPRRSHQ